MDLLTTLGIVELSVFPASLEDLFLHEYQKSSCSLRAREALR
jgi:hypothetical protein